ncbi:monooxygenase [Dactylosporangium sp. CA-052675]|uniref:monooxygenase n=1 Tax=Dactylosporangium sp. CA-052675 TaxID=3239927 RepID=UPI003D94D3D7
MPAAYTPQAPNGGTDEYRCFLIDPKLTKTAYLTGSQFLPQNAAIVHHAIFFRIAPNAADQARKLDEDSPGEGWTCFGDSGVTGDAWVASWAPGANETLLAPNLGYPMPPGSLMVMQVHYNLLATGGRAGGTDQSSIRLRINDESTGMTPLQTGLLPGPIELPCAAGESGPLCDRAAAVADVTKRFGAGVGGQEDQLIKLCNQGAPPVAGTTQHCDHKVPQAATVYAVGGHMHLLGRSIKIELNPGTAGARTLLDVPNYNFDDQAIRPLDQPAELHPGDTLRVTCTHDAALRGLLPQLKGSAPRYVVWGDGTSDEMCLGLVVTTAGASKR